MSSLNTKQIAARDELVAYLKTLDLTNLEEEEYAESAEGILEWNLEQQSAEDAKASVLMYCYSEAEAEKIAEIVHRHLK